MNPTYGSICSGIEAATLGWHALGWTPAWFSEIEPFPCAVLAHHWPHVTNLGDMTTIAAGVRSGIVDAPDILVGGTPCQAFSIAGLRGGLTDTRGQLTLSYVELANAIDKKRSEIGQPAAVIVWENVPGVLSDKTNAFGCFLAGLAGEDSPLIPSGKKWTHAGAVHGPERAVVWRILDAQFVGVAQQRKRVFVVASARQDFDPGKVLFEFDGVRRDIAPGREPQTAVAALTANGAGTCGADHNQGQTGHLIPHKAYRMTAFGEYADDETASTCKARDWKDATDLAVCVTGDITHTLQAEGCAASTDMVMAVRRLMPVECERLQGMPDDHTKIPWRGKAAEQCADTPRYKAIGNSMAVPCMRWIGERIQKEGFTDTPASHSD